MPKFLRMSNFFSIFARSLRAYTNNIYTMAQNKGAIVRYHAIDRCLRK